MSVVANAVSTLNPKGEVAANSRELDAALVEGARRRDPEALEDLVTRYGP